MKKRMLNLGNYELREKIIALLNSKEINFKHIIHDPTHNCIESAIARKEDLKNGGKSLILKVENEFMIFVLSAKRKFKSIYVRNRLGVKRMRFATESELADLGGFIPGAIPPIGKPIVDIKLYLDNSILDNSVIAFNCGLLNESIVLDIKDYLEVIEVEDIFIFSV